MALNKVKNRSAVGTGGFDLGAMADSIVTSTDTKAAITTRRQAAEQAALARTQQETKRARAESMQISEEARTAGSDIRQQQLEILGGISGQIEKANTAMQLADSDNPLDRLNLWFLQQGDASYTREGNLARMNYLNQAAASVGNIDVLNQQEYQSELQRVQEGLDATLSSQDDTLEMLRLQETQGQELIDAEIQASNARLGIMQNQNSMQSQAMVNMTDDQVTSAVQAAAKAPTQSLNVGGVDISLAQLQDRQRAIEERRHNDRIIQASAADQAIGSLTVEELTELETTAMGSKKRMADVNGVLVPAGKIRDRIFAMNDQEFAATNQKYALSNINEDLILKTQDKSLATREVVELQAIIDNGMVDPISGISYDRARVITARDARAENDMQMAQQQATQANMTSPAASGAAAMQYVDSIAPNIPPTSPDASNMNLARSMIQSATTQMASGNPADQLVANQVMEAARTLVDNSVANEAKRLAAGDKDMEIAYGFQLRGQPVPRDLIEATIQTRASKGEPIGRWLSNAQNAEFQRVYRQTLYDAQSPAAIAANGGLAMPKDAAESLAFDTAMGAIKSNIAGPMSDQVLMAQPYTAGHPLNGVITGDEFGTMMRNADTLGMQNFAQTSGLTPEQVQAAQASGDPSLVASQNAALYQALEKKRPGLGDKYVAWWSDPEKRGELVTRVISAGMDSAKGDFTKTAEMSLVAPSFQDSFGGYGMSLVQGKQNVYQQQIQEEHANFIAFGNNPQAKQVFLLEQTPNLTNTEKQIAMQSVIQPLLDLAKANGYENAQQVTTFVETQLRTYEPENPQARSVLRKIMMGRDASLKVVNDLIVANTNLGAENTDAEMRNYGKGFDWYTQLTTSGAGQLPQVRMNPGMK